MPGQLLYVEPSALFKLVVVEEESARIDTVLAAWPHQVSSAITAVETGRAVRRATESDAVVRRADDLVAQVPLIALDAAVIRLAAKLPPPTLRSLDAIHLATALSLGEDLGAFLTCDRRLRAAATAAGVTVVGLH